GFAGRAYPRRARHPGGAAPPRGGAPGGEDPGATDAPLLLPLRRAQHHAGADAGGARGAPGRGLEQPPGIPGRAADGGAARLPGVRSGDGAGALRAARSQDAGPSLHHARPAVVRAARGDAVKRLATLAFTCLLAASLVDGAAWAKRPRKASRRVTAE